VSAVTRRSAPSAGRHPCCQIFRKAGDGKRPDADVGLYESRPGSEASGRSAFGTGSGQSFSRASVTMFVLSFTAM
jgi:hypothetical protein